MPDGVNIVVARHAKAHGVPVILDLGGDEAPPPDELLDAITYVAPNETELQRLVGLPTGTDSEIAAAAAALQARGVPNVLVTVGAGGSVLFSGTGVPLRQPCFPAAEVVDTTGAGDCFRGAFACALAAGRTLSGAKAGPQECLEVGAAASSHCVTVLGAMNSMPTPEEADAVMARAH